MRSARFSGACPLLPESDTPPACAGFQHRPPVTLLRRERCKAIATMLKAQINKTDRNDARGMAQMMRAGIYRPVQRSQKLRMLLTHRSSKHAAFEEMVLAKGLGDADCQAPRDEKGDCGPGAPVSCDHAPHMG
jgi:hypothetical protein